MPSVISDITISAAKRINKKYMVEVGGCAWDAFWNHSIIGKIVAPYMYFNEYRGVKHASYATYVTEKWLQKRYPNDGIKTSASNVYLKELDTSVLNNRVKKIAEKNIEDPVIIGTTAAVNVKYKGQEYIIKAISELNKKGHNYEYELVGGGDTSYLKNLASKLGVGSKVRFKGVLINENVINWLDSIDVYAQPSKQEGLPRALVEAISRGCPAIGSETAGIPELIDNDYIFKNGDVTQICSILKEISTEKSIEMAKRNFEKAKDYELENLDEKRNAIYNLYKQEIQTYKK